MNDEDDSAQVITVPPFRPDNMPSISQVLLISDDKAEDLKASINVATKLFHNLSHAKSSAMAPATIITR